MSEERNPFRQYLEEGSASSPFEPDIERRLRRGAVKVDARLDLHGLTQEEAYKALRRFIPEQAGRGKKQLLVITGKGSKGNAILRTNVPRWCDVAPLKKYILGIHPAALKHGGEGALYVVLKRERTT
ncbi:MAG: hypothetical protein HGA90_07095 [Alphaproteobacteria bacterium]|nr:hypothetical protein [Alphaproteobacteria bacterium]